MDQFNDLASFVAVAETMAFASAARRLGASTSGVSKSINRLEKRLGVRLFTRTTRRVALTAEGKLYYARSRDILEALADAEGELADASKALKGRIRIDMPIVFGERHVIPLLAAFKQLHPGVDLDIMLSDTITNLVEDSIDVAIRFGDLGDSRIMARKIGICRLITCASPAYLKANGTPKTINDLSSHTCVTFQFRSSGRSHNWRFSSKGKTVEKETSTSLVVNDGSAHRRLAFLGAGIVQDLNVNVAEEIANGSLIEILKSHSVEAFPLSIVWPAGRHQTKRVRELVDYLHQNLRLPSKQHKQVSLK
jgi:LysR family transcriptional regulator, regulator for bpeEF and oprC